MIDCENAIYTEVATKVKAKHQNANVSGDLNLSPAKLPAVFIEMSDNYPYRNGADGSTIENFCVAVFDVTIFTNSTNSKKSEAKAIQRTVDEAFSGIGFRRTMLIPMNGNDATQYRLNSRYEAVVSKDLVIYRR